MALESDTDGLVSAINARSVLIGRRIYFLAFEQRDEQRKETDKIRLGILGVALINYEETRRSS